MYNSNKAYFYMVVSKTSLPLIKQNNMSVKRLHRDEPLIHQLNYIYAHEQKEFIRIDLTKYKKKKTQKCYKKQVDQSI